MAGTSSRADSGGKKKARVEIIPLIDVVFFLLATFVLFTLSLNKSNGVHVSLPESETGEVRDPSESATITVTADGTLAWDKDSITLPEFLSRLSTFQQTHGDDSRILINGDADAMFTQVLYVFDQVRKVGIQKVYIETKVRPAGSA